MSTPESKPKGNNFVFINELGYNYAPNYHTYFSIKSNKKAAGKWCNDNLICSSNCCVFN